MKTDSNFTNAQRLSLRYNHQNFTGKNFENGGTTNALEHSGDSVVKTRTFNATLTSVFTSALLNEARMQVARDQEPGLANTDDPEAVIREGGSTVLTIGRNNFSPRETTIKRVQFADTVTWIAARTKSAWAATSFDRILNFFPGNFSGSYVQLARGLQWGHAERRRERYVQAFGARARPGHDAPDIDELRLRAGRMAREPDADSQRRAAQTCRSSRSRRSGTDPQLARAGIDTSTLKTDTNNWVRAWAWPGPSGQHYVVRAGYGLFCGRTPSIMVGTAHSNNGINVQTITFTGALVPTYPNIFTSIPAGATLPKPSIFIFDNAYQNARVQQASTGVDYAIGRNTSLSVSYLFVHGDQLPRSTDINIGAATPITFAVAGTGETIPHYRFAAGPFTNFARIISFQSTAVSTYQGLTFEANRRFSGGLQGRASYTVGRVTDTVPDATAVVPGGGDDAKFASNPADFDADRTVGNNDQRQRLVLSGVERPVRRARGPWRGTC